MNSRKPAIDFAIGFRRLGFRVAPMIENRPLFAETQSFATNDENDLRTYYGDGDPEWIRNALADHHLKNAAKYDDLPAWRAGHEHKAERALRMIMRPTFGVGVWTGAYIEDDDDDQRPGSTVIDVDGPSHGTKDGKTGIDFFRDLMGCHPKDAAAMVIKTSGDGYHLHYKYHKLLPSRGGLLEKFPHIDCRNGGMVPVPNTLKDGKRYRLIQSCHIDALTPVPKKIIDAYKEEVKEKKKARPTIRAKTAATLKEFGIQSKEAMYQYVKKWEPAEQGTRGSKVFQNACYLVECFPTIDPEYLMIALDGWNQTNIPPMEPKRVEDALHSALKKLDAGTLNLRPRKITLDKYGTQNMLDRCSVETEDVEEVVTWLKASIPCRSTNRRIVALYLNHRFPKIEDQERFEAFYEWENTQPAVDNSSPLPEDDIEAYLKKNQDESAWLPEEKAVKKAMRKMVRFKMEPRDIGKETRKRFPSSQTQLLQEIWEQIK